MSRIPPSRPRGIVARIVFWLCRRMLGKVTMSLRVNAHHKVLFSGLAHMERAQTRASELPSRLRSLASLRVATLVGCPF